MPAAPRFRVVISGVTGRGITNSKGKRPDTKLKYAWDVGFKTFNTEKADDFKNDQVWTKTFDPDGVK